MTFSGCASLIPARQAPFLASPRFASQGVAELVSSHMAQTDGGKSSVASSSTAAGVGGNGVGGLSSSAALNHRRQRTQSFVAAGHGASLIASVANEKSAGAAESSAASSPVSQRPLQPASASAGGHSNASRFSPNVVRRSSVVQLKSAVASTAFAQSAFSAQISAQLGHQLAAQLSTVVSSQLAAAAAQASASASASAPQQPQQPSLNHATLARPSGPARRKTPPTVKDIDALLSEADADKGVVSATNTVTAKPGFKSPIAGTTGAGTGSAGKMPAGAARFGAGGAMAAMGLAAAAAAAKNNAAAASASATAAAAASATTAAVSAAASHSDDAPPPKPAALDTKHAKDADVALQMSAPMVITDDSFDFDIDIDVCLRERVPSHLEVSCSLRFSHFLSHVVLSFTCPRSIHCISFRSSHLIRVHLFLSPLSLLSRSLRPCAPTAAPP
jgi:hypothetical protein